MTKLKDHPNLKAFKQHGFVWKKDVGNQVCGYSIFSGKDKFFINPVTKQWDCKVSGEHGGYQQFLKKVHAMSLQHMKGRQLGLLKKGRGLNRATLKKHEVGYNPHTGVYLIPVYDANHENLWDLRIYNPKTGKIFGTAGCNTGLYGWDEIGDAKKVWLCEGEWDKMAMWEILSKTERLDKEVAVAVPGANTFKGDWSAMFKDKKVICVYDRDDNLVMNGVTRPGAGPAGSVKIHANLSSIASNLQFVHWPEDNKNGFDIRDFLIETADHDMAYKRLGTMLQNHPPIDEEFKKEIVDDGKTEEEVFTGPRISANKTYEAYRKWLHLPDTDIIDVLFGSIIANRMDGDPIWFFFVGPSGCGKSELLLSVGDAPRMMSTTSLTPHALVSGANFSGGGDPSLIPRLKNKVLVIKDFTTILDMNPMHRQEIMGILRDAYDGKTEKMFGNGVFRSYNNINFGLIAGTTPAIEVAMAEQTAVGERFLRYNFKIPKSHAAKFEYLRRAGLNVGKGEAMRADLLEIGTAVLSHHYKYIPTITPAIEEQLIILAQWTSLMRGTILRDAYSKEVIATPFQELGTRLVKQYKKFIIGIGQFRGVKRITSKEYKLVKEIAIGSVGGDLNMICKYIYKTKKNNWTLQKELLEATRLPFESGKRKLENLVMLDVLEKRKVKLSYEFKIKEDMIMLFKEGEIYD